jgi:hypothetical protein
LQLGGSLREPGWRVLEGNFSGLDILGSSSDSPIVVTTVKREVFSSICLIGKAFLKLPFFFVFCNPVTLLVLDWKDGVVIREVALSVIPSDMQNFSEISSISADEINQVCKMLLLSKRMDINDP